MNLLKDEQELMKKGTDMMQRKIDNIYENNILIPKESNGNPNSRTNVEEGNEHREQSAFMNNMQEEVRRLHYKLEGKDAVINKLKSRIQKSSNGNADDDDMNDN
jgi:hypothetical protein